MPPLHRSTTGDLRFKATAVRPLGWLTLVFMVFGCSGKGGLRQPSPGTEAIPPSAESVSMAPAASPEPAVSSDSPSAPAPESNPLPANVLPSNNRELRIGVDVKLDGLKGVELWYTSDEGRSWFNSGRTDGKPEDLRFVAPADGRFGFKVIPIDAEGNRPFTPNANTIPDATVLVDTQAPLVVLESPNGGNCFRNEGYELVTWTATDDHLVNNGMSIEASTDGGASWVPVAKNEPNDGKYFWKLPVASSARMKLRVTARDAVGNEGSDASDAEFAVDGLAPGADFLGPRLSTRSEIQLQYRPWDLGGAGVAKVDCYLTGDEGVHWQCYGEDDDARSPMKVTLLDGEYGVRFVAIDRVGNATEIPRSGAKPSANDRLTVDTQPPQVKCHTFQESTIYAGNRPYPISWTSEDANFTATPAFLEYSEDGGTTWQSIAKDLPPQGEFIWTTPARQGKQYRLRVSAVDALGNSGSDMTPEFVIDPFVPNAFVLSDVKSSKRDAEIPYDIRNAGCAPLTLVELWFTTDRGATWHRYGTDPNLLSPFIFSQPDGEYGVTIVCATELGKEPGTRQAIPAQGEAPQGRVSIDTQPPTVELQSFTTGGCFRGGEAQEVKWKAVDPHLGDGTALIEVSSDLGVQWQPIAPKVSSAEGTFSWPLPAETGPAYRLRISVGDEFGNVGQAVTSRDFGIDSLPPVAHASGPAGSSSTRFTVTFSAQDAGPAGLASVELWSTPLGGDPRWEPVFSTPGTATSCEVRVASAGRYGYCIVAADRVGNATPIPGRTTVPELEVLVDDQKPVIELLNFRGGELLAGGAVHPIRWKASDNLATGLTVTLEYTLDDGRSWKSIGEDAQNQGEFRWTLPMETSERCRVRLSSRDQVGGVTAVQSDTPFAIDASKPLAMAQGPRLVREAKCELAYAAQDFGKAGLKAVRVWYRPRGGRGWKTLGSYEGAHPAIMLELPEGDYDLYCTAEDMLGNVQDPPGEGTEAQISLLADWTPPSVHLFPVSSKAFVTGGDVVEIRWQAGDPHFGAEPVSLWISSKGGKDWEPLALNQPNTGVFLWEVPRQMSDACLLRIQVKDRADLTAEAVSEHPFAIVLGPPSLIVTAPTPTSASRKVELDIRYDGLAPMTSGEIWHTSDDGKTWELLAPAEPGSPTLPVTLPDGAHGFRGVAADTMGNKGEVPAPGTRPMTTLVVDSTPPVIRFLNLPKGRSVPLREGDAGKNLALDWSVADEHLTTDGVTLEVSDDGKTWRVLGTHFASTDHTVHAVPPQEAQYQFRVSVADSFGNVAREEVVLSVRKRMAEVRATCALPKSGPVAGGGRVAVEWQVGGIELADAPVVWSLRVPGEGEPRYLLDRQAMTGRADLLLPAENLPGAQIVLNVRETNGAITEVWASNTFGIEEGTPNVILRTSGGVSNRRPTPIPFEVSGGPDPSRVSVELWYTTDNGAHWTRHPGSIPAGSPAPIPFDAPDGTYGLFAIPFVTGGAVPAPPRNGEAPMAHLVIDTTPPTVTLKNFKGGSTCAGGESLMVFWEAPGEALADHPVSLALSVDSGTSWKEIVSGIDNSGRYLWTLPRESYPACRLRVTAMDPAGNLGTSASSSDFSIESIAANPYITGPRFSNQQETKIAYASGDTALSKLTLFVSEDGGAHWSRAGESVPPEAPVLLLPKEGVYGLFLTGRTESGREGTPPVDGVKPTFEVTYDRGAPIIRLGAKLDGRTFRGGVRETISWTAEDSHLGPAPVGVEFSADDGKHWTSLGKNLPARGELPVTWPPISSPTCRARVTAEDAAGNRGEAMSGTFTLSSGEMAVKVKAPDRTTSHTVRLDYTIEQSGIARPSKIRISWTRDSGQTWMEGCDDADLKSPVAVVVPEDGSYGFWVTVSDDAGASTAQPVPGVNPMCSTLIDTRPPTVKLTRGGGGEVLQGGSLFEVAWEAFDDFFGPTPITLNISSNRGVTWSPLMAGQKNTGRLAVTLPKEDGTHYRLQVVATDLAGNTARAASMSDIAVDGTPPVAEILGPAESHVPRVELRTKLADVGPAGIARASLYLTKDGGETWEMEPVDPGKPIVLNLRDGRYGLALCAIDRAGNAVPAPKPKTPPPFELAVSALIPEVKLVSPGGPDIVLRGGSSAEIRWKCDSADLADKPVTLEWSRDGGATWESIAANLPNSGMYAWKAPELEVVRARLRVTVANRYGVKGSDLSGTDFRITVKTPSSSVVGVGKRPGRMPEAPDAPKEPSGEAPKEAPKAPGSKGSSSTGPDAAKPAGEGAVSSAPASSGEDAEAAYREAALLLDHARACSAEHEYAQAEKFLRQSLEKDSLSGEAHFLLAQTLANQNRTAEALGEYERAAQLDSSVAGKANNDRGKLLHELNRLDEAESAYRESIRTRETREAHYNLGLLQLVRQRYPEAESELRKALEFDPEHVQTLFTLGLAMDRAGKTSEARPVLMKVLEIAPESEYAREARSKLNMPR